MSRTIRKNASRVGNKVTKKENQNRTRNMMVVNEDYTDVLSIDSYAENLMGSVEGKVSPELFGLLNEMLLGFCNDMLLGFCNDMQVVIAWGLENFACAHIIHKSGCLSVDSVLGACYSWIAEEHGIDQEVIMKLMTNRKNN